MSQIAQEQARNIMSRIKEALNKEFSERSEFPRFRELTDDERRQWIVSSVNTLEKQTINDIIVAEIIQEINHDLLIAHIKADQLNKQIRKFMRREFARYAKLQEKRLSGGGGGEELPEPKEPKKPEESKKTTDVVLNFDDLRNFVDRHLAEFKAFEKQAVEDMCNALEQVLDFEKLAKESGLSNDAFREKIINRLKGDAMLSAEEKGQPLIKKLTDKIQNFGLANDDLNATDIIKKYDIMSEINLLGAINEALAPDNASGNIKVTEMLKIIKTPEIKAAMGNKTSKLTSLLNETEKDANNIISSNTPENLKAALKPKT